MNRLHDKGFISRPVGKAKSVVFTDDGERRSEHCFTSCSLCAAKPPASLPANPGHQEAGGRTARWSAGSKKQALVVVAMDDMRWRSCQHDTRVPRRQFKPTVSRSMTKDLATTPSGRARRRG
jgi:hypothetical protein